LQTVFRYKQIHRNKKMRPYKALIKCFVMEEKPGPFTSDWIYDTYTWMEKKTKIVWPRARRRALAP
jgi:hypothetical protein